MVREQFLNYMKSPDSLDDKSLDELDELIKEYPYFQTAQLLLVKNFKNLENIKYENQLKITAAYATDRKVLYYLLNEKHQEFSEESEVEKFEQVIKPVEAKAEDALKHDFREVSASVAREGVKPVAQKKPAESISDKTEDVKPDIQKTEKKVDDTGTDRDKKMEEIASAITGREKGSLADIILQRLEELKKTKKDVKVAEKAAPEKLQDEKINSFSDWLESATSKKKKDKPKITDTELINKFLKEDTHIKPRATGDGRQEDISRESVKEQEEFITETLAEIYVQQGFYEKAINAFGKLRLNSLEKSVYFAEQIKRLGKIINEQ